MLGDGEFGRDRDALAALDRAGAPEPPPPVAMPRLATANDVLSRDEIRALTAPSNAAGFCAVITSWGVIALAFAALARFPHPVTFVLAVVVLGGRQLAPELLKRTPGHRIRPSARAHATVFRSVSRGSV